MGARLKMAREHAGLTQTALGEQLGVRQNTISGWETAGLTCSPDLLVQLARVLRVTTDWLLNLSNEGGPAAQDAA